MKTPALLTLLTLISVGVVFFTLSKDAPIIESIQVDKQPQEYMTQIFIKTYTEEGALKSVMSADVWTYLPEIQSSTVQLPHLTLYRADGTIWHLDAKQGRVQQPTITVIEQIELQNEVVLKRSAALNIHPILLETSVLKYYPEKQYVETNQLVTMTRPGVKITGIGLKGFLEQGTVELLHNVKTHFTVTR